MSLYFWRIGISCAVIFNQLEFHIIFEMEMKDFESLLDEIWLLFEGNYTFDP